jgi:hypothetical protein
MRRSSEPSRAAAVSAAVAGMVERSTRYDSSQDLCVMSGIWQRAVPVSEESAVASRAAIHRVSADCIGRRSTT